MVHSIYKNWYQNVLAAVQRKGHSVVFWGWETESPWTSESVINSSRISSQITIHKLDEQDTRTAGRSRSFGLLLFNGTGDIKTLRKESTIFSKCHFFFCFRMLIQKLRFWLWITQFFLVSANFLKRQAGIWFVVYHKTLRRNDTVHVTCSVPSMYIVQRARLFQEISCKEANSNIWNFIIENTPTWISKLYSPLIGIMYLGKWLIPGQQ